MRCLFVLVVWFSCGGESVSVTDRGAEEREPGPAESAEPVDLFKSNPEAFQRALGKVTKGIARRDCDDVAKHLVGVHKPLLKEQWHGTFAHTCECEDWSDSLRGCLVGAQSAMAISACYRPVPKTSPPARLRREEGSCEDVADYVSKLMVWATSADKEVGGAMKEKEEEIWREVRTLCSREKWGRTEKRCYLQGQTIEELQLCSAPPEKPLECGRKPS